MGWADNDGMRFGLVVPQGWRNDLPGRDFERMVSVTQAAERLGFDSIWLYHHLQTRDGDPAAMLECWTSLAALARETSRVRLGQIVTCALRATPPPRRDAGGGARAVRRTDPRRRRRGARPAAARRAARGRVQSDGLLRAGVLPPQVRRAAPHCEDLQRDYDSILRTATFTVSPGVGRSLFEQLADARVSYFILYVDPSADIDALEQLAAELPLRGNATSPSDLDAT